MATSDTTANDDPLAEASVPRCSILGTRTFQGVIYHREGAEQFMPVDVRMGEPTNEIPSVEQAKASAERATENHHKSPHTPHVAKLTRNTERIVEAKAAFGGPAMPYTMCVFYHMGMVGGYDTHMAYHEAYHSERYDVSFTADYQTGDLTITVTDTCGPGPLVSPPAGWTFDATESAAAVEDNYADEVYVFVFDVPNAPPYRVIVSEYINANEYSVKRHVGDTDLLPAAAPDNMVQTTTDPHGRCTAFDTATDQMRSVTEFYGIDE